MIFDISVEQKTLKLCFSAFNLELREEDYSMLTELDADDANETFS